MSGPTLFAVVCKWADRRVPHGETGRLAIVVEAANAIEAELAANAARPDLWERDGLTRETAVHPAVQLAHTKEGKR